MGFFGFLGKKRRQEIKSNENFSINIPPPPIPSFSDFPDIGNNEEIPLPSFDFDEHEIPKPEVNALGNPYAPTSKDMGLPTPANKPPFGFSREQKPFQKTFEPMPRPIPQESSLPKVAGFRFYEKPLPNFEIEKPRLDLDKPVFLKLDRFKEMSDAAKAARAKTANSEEIIFTLLATESEKEKKYIKWQNNLEDIQRKLIFIDRTIYKD